MDDFSNHPQSITELRSDKTSRAKDWTPRDVLISLLRDIDGGMINPDALVVVYRTPCEDGEWHTHYKTASPDPFISIGLLHIGEHEVLKERA